MKIATFTEDHILTVRPEGNFTFADNQKFRTLLKQIGQDDIKQVIFNLEKVNFIDSAGLGMLLLAHDEAMKYNQPPVTLENAQGQVKKMLSIARFNNFFDI